MMHIRYEWVTIINWGERKAQAKAGVEPCFHIFASLQQFADKPFIVRGNRLSQDAGFSRGNPSGNSSRSGQPKKPYGQQCAEINVFCSRHGVISRLETRFVSNWNIIIFPDFLNQLYDSRELIAH
jgi:hypothetical protein